MTSVRLVKRSVIEILLLFGASLSLSACAMWSRPKPEPFRGKWEFCEIAPQKTLACLPREDVELLREQLIRCNSNVRDSH